MVIFDLDMTVIDTSHRIKFLPDGSQDLVDWVANCVPDKIALDSLLPLADYWKRVQSERGKIAVITSRVMQDADYRFLRDNGLEYNFLLSRLVDDYRPCHEYKLEQFRRLHKVTGVKYQFMRYFDDNLECLKMASKLGVICFDAVEYNNMLSRAVA